MDRPGWNPPELPTTPPTGDAVTGVPLGPSAEVAGSARRSRVGTGIAIAAVGIGALGIAGTAYAASTTPSPSAPSSGSEAPRYAGTPGSTGPQGQPAPQGQGVPGDPDGDGYRGRGMGGGMGLGHMKGLGMGGGIHGTFVVPKAGGGYQTVHTQRGTVTGVSSTEITVKSEDGYTKTYVVTADTVVNAQRDGIASVKTGDEVGVTAVESAGTVTAVRVVDRTRVADGLKPLAPPQPKASPSGSSSSSG